MFIDAQDLPDHAHFEADLAIIGGGVAGITLARALAGSGIRICLIESGGLELNGEVQSLYKGENAGIEYSSFITRLRYFGGSSNHWGGYCRPLDSIDFEARDWVPHSGWPLGFEELESWYKRAEEIVEIAPGRFNDTAYWEDATGEKIPTPSSGRAHWQFVHFSKPTRFGSRYRADLEKAENIQVLLNANVTRIAATEDARGVRQLDVRTLTGLNHQVKARYYVLATGGLENARMLLVSNDVNKAGLGNQNDLVGRFFMDHPHLSGFAEIVAADLSRLPKILIGRVEVKGRSAQIACNPTPDFLRKQRLLNATFMMGMASKYYRDKPLESSDEQGRAHRSMLLAARHFLTDDPAKNPALLGAWLGVGGSCEQSPNPDSRVTLSSQRDQLDMPRIRLDWRLTELDRVSFYTHLRSLALELGALGLGRMLTKVADESNWPLPIGAGSHHMGTTRMSNDASRGVVDRDCKVHGIDNLYVAGSSVFPTSGSANPTLTLVALTLRLADHLKRKIP